MSRISTLAKLKLLAAALPTAVLAVVLYLAASNHLVDSETTGNTLIIYIFSDSDPQYIENLKFFVRYGVSQEAAVHYLIIVQTDSASLVRPFLLAAMSANA